MRVPRCLTMILPALTILPSYLFTPSLFPWLSRPFFVLPPPFFAATFRFLFSFRFFPSTWFTGNRISRSDNVIYYQPGISLPVSVFLVVTCFRVIMENTNFFASVFSLAGSHYPGTFDGGIADSHFIIVSYKEYFIQFDGITLVSIHTVDIND